MPFYRVRKYGRRVHRRGGGIRGRGRRGAMGAARYRLQRSPGTPTFTETYALSNINIQTTGTSTGLLRVAMNQVSQFGDYQALYNQYCIRSAQFILMPEYDQYDANNSTAAATAAATAPRLVYAINNSAAPPTPAVEQDVLQDNAAKILMMHRPVRIRCRPVAEVAMTDSNTNLQYESKKNRWLSFDTPGTAHCGVAYAITQTVPNSVLALPAVRVYVKLTFSLRDPK